MSDDGGASRGRVIVVGSINVDVVMRLPRLPAPGETVAGGVAARHHGGKGANQAVAAARAGVGVHMVGAVGAGDGEDEVAALGSEGITVSGVARCEAPTGLAAVLVDATSGENQIALAAGANDLVTPAQVRDSLSALGLMPADVVVLSFELPEAPLRAAAAAARDAGARLVVNPAPAREGFASLLAAAIATPNTPELAALVTQCGLPGGMTSQAAAVALARHTGGAVVATMGADGALLAGTDTGQAEHFAGHLVAAVDTTGAGDTLTGVLAAGLAQGYDLRASVRRAVAAAALAVTQPGARAGMPTLAEIERLLELTAGHHA
jgi:ribokinase